MENTLLPMVQGVYVLGTKDLNDRLCGCIVDAVMQIEFGKPVLAISLLNTGYTKEVLEKVKVFSLSVLPRDCGFDIIQRFGYQSGKKTDKWKGTDYGFLSQMPVLNMATDVMKATVFDQKIFPEHTLFFAEVDELKNQNNKEKMTYDYYLAKVKPAPKECQNKGGEKWVCRVCGYVYEGDVAFEDLPDDWVCPLCGVGKDMFEKIPCE